uniref:TMEM132 domain-containing protein n=1 Tax=Mesocestoides corti TaxID=53468 RepID=A0A5K3FYL4_MESCO
DSPVTARVQVLLQGHGPFQRLTHVDFTSTACSTEPIRKLYDVWQGGTKQHQRHVLQQHEQQLLLHVTTLLITQK